MNPGSSGFCVGKVGGKGERKGSRRHCSADAHPSSFPRKHVLAEAGAGIQTLRANSMGALYERFVPRERGNWMDSRFRGNDEARLSRG